MKACWNKLIIITFVLFCMSSVSNAGVIKHPGIYIGQNIKDAVKIYESKFEPDTINVLRRLHGEDGYIGWIYGGYGAPCTIISDNNELVIEFELNLNAFNAKNHKDLKMAFEKRFNIKMKTVNQEYIYKKGPISVRIYALGISVKKYEKEKKKAISFN